MAGSAAGMKSPKIVKAAVRPVPLMAPVRGSTTSS